MRFLLLFLLLFSNCRQPTTTIPEEAYATWNFVIEHNKAPKGHVGGRRFMNYERLLPQKTVDGSKIYYREWDIFPKIEGQNRGPHRLVTGSNKTAYYTPDHYASFIPLHKP